MPIGFSAWDLCHFLDDYAMYAKRTPGRPCGFYVQVVTLCLDCRFFYGVYPFLVKPIANPLRS